MKKLTHIAAPVALTALVSACATPPGPAGGAELRAQVEKVTTALLADQTVEGLRDNFEGLQDNFEKVKTQFVGSKGASTLEQRELMAGLEEDFEGVDKQLKELEEQTDSTAKLDLANALKGKLEDIQKDIQKLEDAGSVSVYRKLTYTFRNLDAVELTRKSRQKYVDDLKKLFYTGRDDKKYEELGVHEVPDPDGTGQVSEIMFTLSDLRNGILDEDRKDIEDAIKMITDDAPVVGETTGIPVVKVDSPARRITFKTREVEYSSASGAPEKVISVSARECSDVTLEADISSIVKQENATKHMWLGKDRGQPGEKIKFAFPPNKPTVYGDAVCGYSDPMQTAFLMVLLEEQDEKKREYYYVAEYHRLIATIPSTGGSGEVEHSPEPGRLTEDKPACPPGGWPMQVQIHFQKKLELKGGCI